MKFDKVFLIGFMGCGKSTFGRKIAEQLDWDFVDLDATFRSINGLQDAYIEEQQNASIQTIFANKGESYFRNLETKAIEESSKWKKTIISTGGGTPCFNNNITSINNIGLSVYLKLSPEVLKSRLEGEKSKRPLISNLSDAELLIFINKKLAERSCYYSKSEITFEYSNDLEVSFMETLRTKILN